MEFSFIGLGQLTTFQRDLIREKICEENHIEKPKQKCSICGVKECAHCFGDPMNAYNETYCPHCELNLSEE